MSIAKFDPRIYRTSCQGFSRKKTFKNDKWHFTFQSRKFTKHANPEILRKVSNKTKSIDLGIWEIQKLVLKLGIVTAKVMNVIWIHSKSNFHAGSDKNCIPLCKESAMLIGQTICEILSFCKTKIMAIVIWSREPP